MIRVTGMIRPPVLVTAAAAALGFGGFVGLVGWAYPPVALGLLGASIAAGFLLSLHIVSRRIASGTERLEKRLNLDQLQRGQNDSLLATSYSATPDLIWIVAEELLTGRPRQCVELGPGLSTLVLARIIRSQNLNCRLLSVEHDAAYAQRIRDQVIAEGLERVVTVVDAPIEPISVEGYRGPWYRLADWVEKLGPIDVVLVDGPLKRFHPAIRSAAVPVLQSRLAPGALIVLDDAQRKPERRALAAWRRLLPGSTMEYHDAGHGIGVVRCAGAVEKTWS